VSLPAAFAFLGFLGEGDPEASRAFFLALTGESLASLSSSSSDDEVGDPSSEVDAWKSSSKAVD
jgi:hypothetical protein